MTLLLLSSPFRLLLIMMCLHTKVISILNPIFISSFIWCSYHSSLRCDEEVSLMFLVYSNASQIYALFFYGFLMVKY